MTKKKPVNLALTTIRFPMTAIVSILHRLSGVTLFLLVPFMLWILDASLANATSFIHLMTILQQPFLKFVVWVLLSAFAYHIAAGIRHLIMDAGYWESLRGGSRSAVLLVVVAAILIFVLGMWIW